MKKVADGVYLERIHEYRICYMKMEPGIWELQIVKDGKNGKDSKVVAEYSARTLRDSKAAVREIISGWPRLSLVT